jgi:hypothetical protein
LCVWYASARRPLLVNITGDMVRRCKVEMPTVDALAEIEAGHISVIADQPGFAGRGARFFKRISVRNLERIPIPTTR